MHFPDDVWHNILSYVPDLKKQKQQRFKRLILTEIKYFAADWKEWLDCGSDIEDFQDTFPFYFIWLSHINDWNL